MAEIELVTCSTTPKLLASMEQYINVRVVTVPTLDTAQRLLLDMGKAPGALYIEDTAGTMPALDRTIEVARSRGVPVFVGLQRAGKLSQADFEDAGVATIVAPDSPGDLQAQAVAAWLAGELRLRKRAGGRAQAQIAIGGGKGGVGKSLVTSLLAEVSARAGLHTLVIDSDLSNTGLQSIFRFRSGIRSYTELARRTNHEYTAQDLRAYIYADHVSGIHFLVGAEDAADAEADLYTWQWDVFMQAVRNLDDYDLVLIDTGPELRKRPYIVSVARDGGVVVLPTPPGRKEREGAGKALRVMEAQEPDLTGRCYLLMMGPEAGVDVAPSRVAAQFLATFPELQYLGELPRAARLISRADEPEQYVCPLDLAPHSAFARSVYAAAERLFGALALQPPTALPRPGFWQRLRGNRIAATPLPLAVPPLHRRSERLAREAQP